MIRRDRPIRALAGTLLALLLTACASSSDEPPILTGNRTSIPLQSDSGLAGSLTLNERSDGATLLVLQLNGPAPAGGLNVLVRSRSAAEGSPTDHSHGAAHTAAAGTTHGGGGSSTVLASLPPLAAGDTRTQLLVERLADQPLRYADWETLDAHLALTEPQAPVNPPLATADLGGNRLTGTVHEVVLAENAGSGVAGTATLAQRRNGFTLVTLQLSGTPAGGSHIAHLHPDTWPATPNAPVAAMLNNVDGSTGTSRTTLRRLDNDSPITYEQLLQGSFHIKVHPSATDLGTVWCVGNL